MVNIVASTFFGGISGSAAADTASLGTILIPMMEKDGYDGEFSTAATMSSSVQGLLIPPSHNIVIYAIAGGLSVGKLFMGGLVPGMFLSIVLMIFTYFVSIKRHYPKGEKFCLKTLWKTFKETIWGLVTVLIVVVGVVAGIFTATEAAAISTLYAFIITFFVYREIPISHFAVILKKHLTLYQLF